MKTTSLIIACIFMLASVSLFAQKAEVNTEKSTIEWIGKKVGGEHNGNIQLKSGHLNVSDNAIVSGKFVIDMTTITNIDLKNEGYNKKLVDHLKSDDFFGVKDNPEAIFEITKGAKFTNGKATIHGNITIKGKTESISFDVTKSNDGYSSELKIDRSKFNVKYGSDSFFDNLGDKAIDDIFILNVNVITK